MWPSQIIWTLKISKYSQHKKHTWLQASLVIFLGCEYHFFRYFLIRMSFSLICTKFRIEISSRYVCILKFSILFHSSPNDLICITMIHKSWFSTMFQILMIVNGWCVFHEEKSFLSSAQTLLSTLNHHFYSSVRQKNRKVGEKNPELRCDPPKWEKRNRISGCQMFTISF